MSTFTSWGHTRSPAVTVLGPVTSTVKILGLLSSSSESISITNDLRFKIIAVTSSSIPFKDVNSCLAPSICTEKIEAPGIEESKTLLIALPIVMPNPPSNGDKTNLA